MYSREHRAHAEALDGAWRQLRGFPAIVCAITRMGRPAVRSNMRRPPEKESHMAVTTSQPTSPATAVTSYRAAVVHDFHAPLTIEQVPRRELLAGQILVKVEATGLCHTDIHAAHGDWPVKPSPPFIPGH